MKTLSIRMKADDTAEVLLYGVIGEDFFGDGIMAKDFRDQVKSVKAKAMNLRINSPGGSVTEGAAMLNALDEWKGRIEVDIDGLAASAASFVAMAGDTVRVSTNGLVMIHNPHALVIGGAGEMRRTADLLDKVRGQILDAYGRKSKAGRDQLGAWMDAETWFTGPEAVEAGLADAVTEPMRVAACASPEVLARLGYKKVPEAALHSAAAEAERLAEETRKRRLIVARLLST
jgi:ATP-dependent Clp protease, protease subunit